MRSPCARCPAAQQLAGPPIGGPSIICGVLRREGAAQDGITEGDGHEHLTATADPSMVFGFCCGTAVPAATEEQAKGDEPHGHYTFCSIWVQEKDRIAADRERAWRGKSKLGTAASAEEFAARIAS